MYSEELKLISYKASPDGAKDEIGNPKTVPEYTSVLCKVRDVGSQEFYGAANTQLRPEIKFIIHRFEYSGQTRAEYNGTAYKVLRVFGGDTVDRTDNALTGEEIELTCERVM